MNLIPAYSNKFFRLEKDIRPRLLKALMYFEVFSYPLKLEELVLFTGYSKREVLLALDPLLGSDVVKRCDEFYHLSLKKEHIERRISGNILANRKLRPAMRVGRLIGRFPFVRAVGISGSLSKGFLDKDGDFDFFIITAPGRLWLCRSLLVLFKKIFLLNSKRYFCVNYFIDTDHLEVEDKNTFTAVEVNTLIPAYNVELVKRFLDSNPWTHSEAGNPWHNRFTEAKIFHPLKPLAEKILSGTAGDRLDLWFMKFTIKKWKKKFAHFNEETMALAMRSRRYVSKHHPNNFQKRVMDALEAKKKHYEEMLEGVAL